MALEKQSTPFNQLVQRNKLWEQLFGRVNEIEERLQITVDPLPTPEPPSGGGTGIVQSVVAGTDISVDNTDPANPVVSFSGSTGGQVDSIVEGDGIVVDDTDPVNPVVSAFISTDADNDLTFGSDNGLYVTAGGGGSSGTILVAQGSSDGQGPILATNSPAEIIVPVDVALSTGWSMLCKPSGSITVDLRYAAFPTTPTSGDSITGSSVPAISSDTNDSGALTGWTTTLAAGGILQVVVTANTGVRWFCLMAR